MKTKSIKGYTFHEDGTVYSNYSKAFLKPENRRGFLRVSIFKKKKHLGKLMLQLFSDLEDGMKCHYLDGDSTNCNLDNLIGTTDSEIQQIKGMPVQAKLIKLKELRNES